MDKSTTYTLRNRQSLSFLGTPLNLSFLVYFLLIFTYLSNSSKANTNLERLTAYKFVNASFSDNKEHRSTHPFQLPFDPNSSDNESVDNDEDEVNEQHIESDALFMHQFASFLFNQLSTSVDQTPFLKTGSKPTITVQLFILYHSWKSFILS